MRPSSMKRPSPAPQRVRSGHRLRRHQEAVRTLLYYQRDRGSSPGGDFGHERLPLVE